MQPLGLKVITCSFSGANMGTPMMQKYRDTVSQKAQEFVAALPTAEQRASARYTSMAIACAGSYLILECQITWREG